MRIRFHWWTLSLIVGHGLSGAAENCPAWTRSPDIPLCPRYGVDVLDDTYPALAHVVSEYDGDGALARDLTLNILKSSGDRIPQILLTVSAPVFEQISMAVGVMADANPNYKPYKAQWLASLKKINLKPYAWQQDFFHSGFDLATGRPHLRNIRDYGGRRSVASAQMTKSYASQLAGCGVSLGESLPPSIVRTFSYDSEYGGGNIEALPGGLCLHGDDQPYDTYAKFYCGSAQNDVTIEAKWLSVGHVDEIVSVVPISGKSPCNFAVQYASPALALRLLESPQYRDRPFYDFLLGELRQRSKQVIPFSVWSLCDNWVNAQHGEEKSQSEDAAKLHAWLRHLQPWPRKVQAETQSSDANKDRAREACRQGMIQNRDVAQLLRGNASMAIMNRLIEASMQENVRRIESALKRRLPACAIKMIPVPGLFQGGEPVRIPGAPSDAPESRRYKLPERRLASVLPNLTNAVVSEATVIHPNPRNTAFGQYLDETYQQLGVSHAKAETWSYHNALGNAHCGSQSFRFCRPGGNR